MVWAVPGKSRGSLKATRVFSHGLLVFNVSSSVGGCLSRKFYCTVECLVRKCNLMSKWMSFSLQYGHDSLSSSFDCGF